MTVPNYIISHTTVVEHRQRQVQNRPNTVLPEPRPRRNRTGDGFATMRRRMSAAPHAVAERIDPQPACG